jgi:hypothetical protein
MSELKESNLKPVFTKIDKLLYEEIKKEGFKFANLIQIGFQTNKNFPNILKRLEELEKKIDVLTQRDFNFLNMNKEKIEKLENELKTMQKTIN